VYALRLDGRECQPVRKGGWETDENDHPKGALLFMVIYLLILAALWTNACLRVWER